VILIIYALLAEQSISTLFAAALPMGILLALFCILVAKALVWRRPGLAPALTARSADSRTRIVALAATWKIALVFGISLGGIYLGWFSPTEAAAVGAGLAILVAVAGGELSRRDLAAAFDETLVTSAQIFFIFLGGLMFARFVALTQIPVTLTEAVRDLGLAPVAVILIMVAIYVVLGCILETVSMILVTVPVFLPLVMELGYDPVWFGLLVVIVAEMGLITPPVGLNVFVIRSQVGDISLATMFRGVAPFLLAHGLLIGVMILFPGAVMLLPSLLGL
jgi:tripartite ATP-independent transporter DctM subunit